ncbi:MAG: peptidoglycan/LPS O-acetylase OafA/YrhL [Francisellaceae bacterium]|jgi:peptidoglycan/LPS O-acetylase OafA/YrhL
MSNRNKRLDLARGLVMLYVVTIIHGAYWLGLGNDFRSILLFEMPVVFIISGYAFAFYSKNKPSINLTSYIKYAQTRVSRIYIPYFAYAVVCIIVVILAQENTNIQEHIFAWLNPFTRGTGHSISSLTWHLWFIPPFIIVTLLLPIVTHRWIEKLPFALCFLLLVFFLYFANWWVEGKFSTPVFYFFWAYVGYKLGAGLTIKRNILFAVIAIAAILLAIGVVFMNQTLNMQLNKFPPNLMFLWFSCIWIAILFITCNHVSPKIVNYLLENKFVALFVKNGYSIYLWQGIGYATAKAIQSQFEVNVLVTWLMAIILTVMLGTLFSPLEKIKWVSSRV